MLRQTRGRRDVRRALLAAAPLVPVLLSAVFITPLRVATPDALERSLGLGDGLFDTLTAAVLAGAGGLLLYRRAGGALGWLLALAGTAFAVDNACAAWLGYAVTSTPALAGASFAFWFYNRIGVVLLLPLPALLALYPDGRLPRGRWRAPVAVVLAAAALLPVTSSVVPSRVAIDRAGGGVPAGSGLDLDPTTLPLPDGVARTLLALSLPVVLVALGVCTAAVVARHRAATGDDRRRLRWLLWAALVDLLVLGGGLVLPVVSSSVGLFLAVTVTAGAVVVGVLRPSLVDVDALLGGTFVYGLLAAAVLVLDLAVAAAAGAAVAPAERETLLLVLLVAGLGYLPARALLWRVARRWLLGGRDDPYRVVSALAERLETADTPQEQLPAVAAAVAAAFRVRYVGVEVERAGGDRVRGEHGTAPDEVDAFPISYRGEVVGRLLLPRSGVRARLSRRDEQLLGDVVRQAAVATRAAQLAAQLQASREALVVAREEERRRIRRDLHDGLGPALGAVALRIDTARNLARTDPERSDEVLRTARAEAAAVLADVRRLVHDLRPPALDDVGLAGALRQHAERSTGADLCVEVHAGELGELPAAVEVAAYRIATEAVHNTARHAAAAHCAVQLVREAGCLRVQVTDDGRGIAADQPSGVGLVSVRERAAELGGRCEILCPPDGGTVVRAWLPLEGP